MQRDQCIQYVCHHSVVYFFWSHVECSISTRLDFSTSAKAFWQLCLNNQSSPEEMASLTLGKTEDDARWAKVSDMAAHSFFWSTTPTGFSKSRRLKHFCLLVLMCLWSNEWSGLSVLTHYLDPEPAPCCGRLFSSDKAGMLNVWCQFKAYSAAKVMPQLY